MRPTSTKFARASDSDSCVAANRASDSVEQSALATSGKNAAHVALPRLNCTEDDALFRNAEILDRLSRRFPTREDPELGSLVRPSDREEPVQRLFHYREGYTVELCRRFISEEEGGVFDPFCGFGSTLLAAKQLGIRSVGFDVNPLAAFVSRVKTEDYAEADLRALELLLERLAELRADSPLAPKPALRIIDRLFHPEILNALNVFKYEILRCESPKAKDLAFACWLSVLEGVSNVFREGNGVKYRNRLRRGNVYTVRPYNEWAEAYFPNDKFGFVLKRLSDCLGTAMADVKTGGYGPPAEVFERDALQIDQVVPSASVSLAMFSPPYCNLFNYIKAYKLELWMGGFLNSYSDIQSLTAKGIRSRLEGLRKEPDSSLLPEAAEIANLISQSQLWSDALPDVVRGYFTDMTAALSSLHEALRPEGRTIVVVGNSALAGVLIPTDLLLSAAAEKIGFSVANISVARHLTTSSQQKKRLGPLRAYMRESIITLEKQ